MYPNQDELKNVLEKYGRDITELVKNNKIDPVIGRDEEIRNITRILSRKTKNNQKKTLSYLLRVFRIYFNLQRSWRTVQHHS